MTIYGLSTTAIGHRPLSEALNIYETLKRQMNLSYLELAIGTVNPTECQLPRPKGRSLQERARLTRESGSQSATLTTGRQDPLRDASSVPDKVRITLAKGKAPQVLTAAARQEPVANIPEGRRRKRRVTRPVRAKEMAACCRHAIPPRGFPAYVDDYPEPLILHDACLYHNGARIPFSIINEEHWHFYKTFTRRYKVLQVHLHAPRKNAIDESAIKTQVEKLMNFLELPVLIEIMPSPEYHYACPEIAPDVPIVLDISHAHIWARGNETSTQKYVQRLLPQAHCIHLSYNDGYRDTHDLIPQDSWIHTIAKPEATITYESLPAQFAKYQRRDFGRFHFLKPYHLQTNPASLL